MVVGGSRTEPFVGVVSRAGDQDDLRRRQQPQCLGVLPESPFAALGIRTGGGDDDDEPGLPDEPAHLVLPGVALSRQGETGRSRQRERPAWIADRRHPAEPLEHVGEAPLPRVLQMPGTAQAEHLRQGGEGVHTARPVMPEHQRVDGKRAEEQDEVAVSLWSLP